MEVKKKATKFVKTNSNEAQFRFHLINNIPFEFMSEDWVTNFLCPKFIMKVNRPCWQSTLNIDRIGNVFWSRSNQRKYYRYVLARIILKIQESGHLPSAHSVGKNDKMRQMATNTFGTRNFWIGLTRNSVGGFQWSDGSETSFQAELSFFVRAPKLVV